MSKRPICPNWVGGRAEPEVVEYEDEDDGECEKYCARNSADTSWLPRCSWCWANIDQETEYGLVDDSDLEDDYRGPLFEHDNVHVACQGVYLDEQED